MPPNMNSFYTTYLEPITSQVGIHDSILRTNRAFKLFLHSGTEEHTINGVTARFQVDTWEEYRRFTQLNELDVIADLLSEINSTDTVYDVGANVGMYTCFLAQRLPSDQVIAFEPHPENVNKLKYNIHINDVDARVIEKGLSNTNGTAELAVDTNQAGAGEHSIATTDSGETIEIKLVTGDELIDSNVISAPTILKVDVEGAELRVLQGLKKILKTSECRTCYIEVHPDRLSDYGGSVEDIEDLLDACGFDTGPLYVRGGEYFIKAVK